MQILKSLYSECDNRHNLDQVDRLNLSPRLISAIHAQAKGVACLVNESILRKIEGGWKFIDKVPTLSEQLEKKFEQKKFRKEEKFVSEYSPGFGTAFLIEKRLALTAAHCICKDNTVILNEKAIQSTRLVFGFHNVNEDPSDYFFADNQVYQIKKVISFQYTRAQDKSGNFTDWADWALLELNEDAPFTPLRMNMTKKVAKRIDLYMLGHPTGLSLKFAHKATVQKNNHADFFESDLDAFEGNSGSPVLNQEAEEVAGILCSGNVDYDVINHSIQAHRISRLEVGQKGYEVCQRVSSLRFLYDEHLLGIRNSKIQENVSKIIIKALKDRYHALIIKDNTVDLLLLDSKGSPFCLERLFVTNQYTGKKRLLIIGEAGSGKSFLSQQITSKWNQNVLWPDKFKALFWIPLCKLKHAHSLETTASFIFRVCCQEHSEDLYPDDLRTYLTQNRDQILFLLDGIDELTENCVHKKILDEILEYPYWIATARSTGTYSIATDLTIKNGGLTPFNIDQYLHKKDISLINKIHQNPILFNLCRIPIHLEVIASFMKSSKSNICMIHSMTLLCEELCFRLQKHFLIKKGLSIAWIWEKEHFQQKEILKPESENQSKEINFIGNLFEILETAAWKGLQKEKDLILETGFIQLQENQEYSFVSPTFQQFFVARYLIRLLKQNRTQAIEILQKMKSDYQHDIVLGFMVDLLKEDKENLETFLKILNHPQEGIGIYSAHLRTRFLKLCGWKGDPGDLFASIQSAIELNDFSSAEDNLLFLFSTDADPRLCYNYLFKLLPHFKTLEFLVKNLPNLIQRSSDLTDLHYQLNTKLAHWNINKNQYQEAIYWSAKALQISQSKRAHELTSQLFFKIIEKHLQNFLDSGDLQINLKEYLIRADSLIPFCVTEEDRNSLYTLVKSKLKAHPNQFIYERQTILEVLKTPFKRQLFTTEKYLEIFQKNPIQAVRNFLEDLFLILGKPPCHYDIRKAKLLNKTACEFVILVKKADSYFTSLIEILKIQLLLIGKNAEIKLVTSESTLDSYELKTISLKTNHPALFQESKKFPIKPPEMNTEWKQCYATSLLEFLTDLALYYNIAYTNIFDLIDAIEIFTKDSRTLLKESVALLDSDEIELIEKCHLLVMSPLTHCIFNSTHLPIDLVQISFDKSFPIPSNNLTRQIATHLWQTNAPLETHLFYFETLSKQPQDSPRQIYLECIKNKPEIFQILLEIPNQSGLRLGFGRNLENLELGLYAITDDRFQGGEETVAITTCSSSIPRYLKPFFIKKILEGTDVRKMYKNGAHRVCRLEYQQYDFHFKQKPSHPLMEYAVHNLTSRIAGNITPTNLLIRFDVRTSSGKKSYPVLISQTISGKNLKTAWQEVKANPNFTWTLLCAILTRPGDGRLSNYILDHEQNLHCVDNDISFVEPVVKEMLSRSVNFCSSPFCVLPLNTPLDLMVLQQFSSLDSLAILDAWINDVIQKEKEYIKLFTEEERKVLYQEDPINSFTPTILFREGTLATLYLQFWQLQNKIGLILKNNSIPTAGDLLKMMISLREENIGPYIHKSYNNMQPTPEKKLQKSTSRNQEHSMTSIQYQQVCLGKIPTLQEIEKARLYSPEKAKKEFLFTLLERSSHYASVKSNMQGTTLQANFQDLKNDLSRQRLVLQALIEQAKILKPTSVIIQHSSILKAEHLQLFLHSNLTHLDLRYCSSIDNNALSLIHTSCPQLKELLLSGTNIAAFQGGVFSRILEFLQLKTLELDRCPTLYTVQLRAPKLQLFTAKHNPMLQDLQLKTMPNFQVDCTDSFKARITHLPLECVRTLKGHRKSVRELVLLADGTLTSISNDKSIKLWDLTTGTCKQILQEHSTLAMVQLFDGTLAISTTWGTTIKLWDPKSGACVKDLQGHNDWTSTFAQLADGTLASGSEDNTIKLWDPITGACKKTLQWHKAPIRALLRLADGTLASASKDKTIKLWDSMTGDCKKTLEGHSNEVYALLQLADGTLASASEDYTIKLWDLNTGACKQTLRHSSLVHTLLQLSDGALASASEDNAIKLWNPTTGACKRTLNSPNHDEMDFFELKSGRRNTLVQFEDGTLAFASTGKNITLWDPTTGACKQTLKGHTGTVNTLVHLANGTLVSGSEDNSIKLWQ
ncbi:MAG: NACHT domain-containing protein [Parachlamydiaceae bacterium]|nr:NACHT domain-containing protein [Parachlamydiaceae bacterium]